MGLSLQALLGYVGLLVLAWGVSEDRRRFDRRVILGGIALQWLLALVILKIPPVQSVFGWLDDATLALQHATREGTAMVFGYIGGAPAPFATAPTGSSFILAFQAFPMLLVVSAICALLFHWGALPWLVKRMSWVMERFMGIGGAVSVSTAANIFLGTIDAPLFVKPYLQRVSRGELFIILSAGMAGVAGTVMGLYAAILGPTVPDALTHILAASFISAPAAVVFSVLMVPLDGPPTGGNIEIRSTDSNAMEAVCRGTQEGLTMLLTIIASLIVALAFLSLCNQALALLPHSGQAWSLQQVVGWVMMPLAWMAGIPWSEAATAGALMGTKLMLNETVAYLDLAALSPEALSQRSRVILTYGLCGFANIGSLGIMIGAMLAMVPERKADILALSPKTLVAGTLATLSCGSIVGVLT